MYDEKAYPTTQRPISERPLAGPYADKIAASIPQPIDWGGLPPSEPSPVHQWIKELDRRLKTVAEGIDEIGDRHRELGRHMERLEERTAQFEHHVHDRLERLHEKMEHDTRRADQRLDDVTQRLVHLESRAPELPVMTQYTPGSDRARVVEWLAAAPTVSRECLLMVRELIAYRRTAGDTVVQSPPAMEFAMQEETLGAVEGTGTAQAGASASGKGSKKA